MINRTKYEQSPDKSQWKISPCPHCGSEAFLEIILIPNGFNRVAWSARTACSDDICNASQGWKEVSEPEAFSPDNTLVNEVVKEWNRRTP